MHAFNQLLNPACLNRRQFWVRVAILVPLTIGLSLLFVNMIASGHSPGVFGNIGLFVKAALAGAVVARFQDIGVRWLTWLAGLSSLTFILAPIVSLVIVVWGLKPFGVEVAKDQPFELMKMISWGFEGFFSLLILFAGIFRGYPERLLPRRTAQIARRPAKPTPYLRRGNVYCARGQYTEAAADFSQALALKPGMKAAERALEYAHSGGGGG